MSQKIIYCPPWVETFNQPVSPVPMPLSASTHAFPVLLPHDPDLLECVCSAQVYTGLYWSLPRDRLEGGTGVAAELDAAADAPSPDAADEAAPEHVEGRAPLIGSAFVGTTRPPMVRSAGV